MRLFRFLLLTVHLVLAAALLLMLGNRYISPHIFPYLNLLSLGFPFIISAYAFITLIWILTLRKRAILFILIGLLLVTPVRRWINFTSKKETGKLKIISFNGKNNSFGKENIRDYLKNQNADIVFGQELELDAIEGYYIQNDYVVCTASKYKILNHDVLVTGGNNSQAQYADIEINGKIYRFLNVYLEPFYFEKSMVKPTESSTENETKAKNVGRKLLKTFKIHAQQVDALKSFINNSPYPVFICGDFNAVPNSYEYFKMSDGLKDAFLEAGRGSGTSFHDYKFPIKIDHIFTSDAFIPKSYRVDRSVRISDHYPVIATFDLK